MEAHLGRVLLCTGCSRLWGVQCNPEVVLHIPLPVQEIDRVMVQALVIAGRVLGVGRLGTGTRSRPRLSTDMAPETRTAVWPQPVSGWEHTLGWLGTGSPRLHRGLRVWSPDGLRVRGESLAVCTRVGWAGRAQLAVEEGSLWRRRGCALRMVLALGRTG